MSNLSVRMNGVMPSVNLAQAQKNNSIAFKGNLKKSILQKSINYFDANAFHLGAQVGVFTPMFLTSGLNSEAFICSKFWADLMEMGLLRPILRLLGNKLPPFGIKNNSLNMFAYPCTALKKCCKSISQMLLNKNV